MKKILLIWLAVFAVVLGQERSYVDAPFGGGGGYFGGWMFPKSNDLLKKIGLPDIDKNGMYVSGGGGFLYLGFVPNVRVGGYGFGGSTSVKNNTSEAIYSVGGGALTIEYTLPFIRFMGVSLGTSIGGGSVTIDKYNNNGVYNYDDIFKDQSPSINTYHKTLSRGYFYLAPQINFDYSLYRFINLRLGAGYQFTFGSDWKIDNDVKIANLPGGLKSDAFYLQLGVYFGLFFY